MTFDSEHDNEHVFTVSFDDRDVDAADAIRQKMENFGLMESNMTDTNRSEKDVQRLQRDLCESIRLYLNQKRRTVSKTEQKTFKRAYQWEIPVKK